MSWFLCKHHSDWFLQRCKGISVGICVVDIHEGWITIRRRSCTVPVIQGHIDGVVHGGLVVAGLSFVFIRCLVEAYKQSLWILFTIRCVVAKLVTILLSLQWILV